MTDKFNENLKKARQGRPNGAQGRFSVPNSIPKQIPTDITKAPQNA